MKLRTSLIALACLASVGAAHAVSPADVAAARTNGTLAEIRLSGASALRLMVGGYIQADLAEPGTLDVYFNDATGALHRAYAFKTKVQIGNWPVGTTMLITKRDQGGSGLGVTPLINGGTMIDHMLVNNACVATANPSPATDITKPTYTCSGVTSAYSHGGISDVEPALMVNPINGGAAGQSAAGLNAAGFVQNIFGVAVNKKLYLALQKAQGLVDASATSIDEAAAKQPSIPRSFVTGALTGTVVGSTATTNNAKTGWNLLVPPSIDAHAHLKKVNVCRRVATSGTQAASNLYFINAACGSTANAYPIQPTVLAGTVTVTGTGSYILNNSSGNVETCLGTTAEGAPATAVANVGNVSDAYALGVLSRENNPVPTDAQGNRLKDNAGKDIDRGYRFVKLSGVAPNRANVISGDYDFVVESSMQWSTVGNNAVPAGSNIEALLLKMRGEMGKASILAGLDKDLQEGLAAVPGTVPAGVAWSDLDATTKSYTSHTNRKAANSCSFVRMTK